MQTNYKAATETTLEEERQLDYYVRLSEEWVPRFTKKADAEKWVMEHFPNLAVCELQLCALETLNDMVQQLLKLTGTYPEVSADMRRLAFVKTSSSKRELRSARRCLKKASLAEDRGDLKEAERLRALAESTCPDLFLCFTAHRAVPGLEFVAMHYASPLDPMVDALMGEMDGRLAVGSTASAASLTLGFSHLVIFWLDKCEEEIEIDGCTIKACKYVDEWLESLDLETAVSGLGRQDPDLYVAQAYVNYYHSDTPDQVAVDVVYQVNRIYEAVRKARTMKHQGNN